MAPTGQFSAALRMCSNVSPAGFRASDWRSSLSTNTPGASSVHMAFPTHLTWSTRTRSLGAIAARLVPRHRQRSDRPEGDAGLVFQLLRFQVQRGEPLHERLERLLALHARQCRPETVVNPRTEGHVGIRVAGDIEPIRVGELRWVPVGRSDEPPRPVQLADDDVPERDIVRRDTLQ